MVQIISKKKWMYNKTIKLSNQVLSWLLVCGLAYLRLLGSNSPYDHLSGFPHKRFLQLGLQVSMSPLYLLLEWILNSLRGLGTWFSCVHVDILYKICNFAYNYAIAKGASTKLYGLGYIGLASKGNKTNWRSTRKSSTSKILSSNMHGRAPMLKQSVRSSSWDNSTFIKRKCVTTPLFQQDWNQGTVYIGN